MRYEELTPKYYSVSCDGVKIGIINHLPVSCDMGDLTTLIA
jgi:hypothetical protein